MNISLEYYKIFYHVAQCKSITLAAQKLSISQPAVSQGVRQLETILGTRLFVRTPKGVRLTAEGEVLYSYVSRGYESILAGEAKVRQMLNMNMGEIRIGASDMTLQFYLLPYLEQFHERFPKIKVSVTNAPTPETLRYLREGKIDFGVVSTPLSAPKEIQITAVKEIQDLFVAGPRFSHLKGRILHYKALEDLPIICLEKSTSTRSFIDQELASHNVVLQPEFELATSDMIVQFAIRNLGIGYVMKEFAQSQLKSGELFPLAFHEKPPQRHFCIVTEKKVPLSTAAQKLLEITAAETQ
ncbi:LysR family transcriptional regulator [Lactonifactor longoviformis]|uniref:LysR family transcriptional regulator n=1 Tax=Lactonifactor longoviformis TaxID=341220 RepID=UPI001D006D53|nr:LysR family transcriptional regulator [Lactonifactor longoviformis]MCB5712350.1 LysR family transcriptional regulator [Lactonifactor longoviformis]MCB5716394.1 LysR family transcriptional regulator [Lactonifactor longoviformis]